MSDPSETLEGLDADIGESMMDLIRQAYPYCRSITGDGLRETLSLIAREIALQIHEVPSGTRVYDWTIPDEWKIRDAFVATVDGKRIIDFQVSNLHVVNYSTPVNRRMRFAELEPHLFTLPDRPDWIPYRTSYYQRDWGFCLTHHQLLAMKAAGPDAEYDVVIDTTLSSGALTYGEFFLPGNTEKEILLTTHVCHPSMCNDNLSGISVLTALGRILADARRRHSFRLLFLPGTIGAIAWLAQNEWKREHIVHGLVLAGLGDRGPLTYKRTRDGDAIIDRVVEHIFKHPQTSENRTPRIVDFSPYGYDERQFNSPGILLPVGRLSRSEYGSYPEYHTSADDLGFVHPDALAGSLQVVLRIIGALETNRIWRNTRPNCEPQLGRYALYDDISERPDWEQVRLALLWVLNLGDGAHDLLSIAERSGLSFEAINAAAKKLLEAGLLSPTDENLSDD